MAERCKSNRTLPSGFQQVLIIARYELFKYFRSKRLIGTIIIIAFVLALIYILPPALGEPYRGSIQETLDVTTDTQFFVGYLSAANLSEANIVPSSLEITVDGARLSETEWYLFEDLSLVLFRGNLSNSVVVASYEYKSDPINFSFGFLNFAEILVILCATFFAADALVGEFQNRTAFLLFPNPVRREIMLAGKFFASFIASFVMLGLFYLVILILSFATIGEVASYLPLSFGFVILLLVACLSLAYMISSILKGSTGSLVLTFFLLLMILPIIEGVGGATGIKMWPLLTFAGHTVPYSLYAGDYPQDIVIDMGPFSFYQFYPEMVLSAVVLAINTVILLLISLLIFRRKEVLG